METYAFSGTLLVLGGCMLHISISATLYRPLAIHALISKQNRNIVQLQILAAMGRNFIVFQFIANNEKY